MLERATGCLENGGRRLLRLASKPRRTRRSLHSAFWCHGAGDIDLPSWWISLLQQPPPEKATRSHTIADTAAKCLSAGLLESGFLDFLYPAKTLTLIHKLAVRDASHLSQWAYRSTNQAGVRPYTSEALTEPLATESELDHAMRLVTTMQQNSATGFKSLSPIPARDGDSKTIEQRMAHNRTGLRAPYNNAKFEYDQAWQRYEKLESSSDIPESTLLFVLEQIGKLSERLRLETTHEVLSAFAAIPVEARTKKYYRWAMTATFNLNDLEQSVQIHSEAWKRGHDMIDSTLKLMRHLVYQEKVEAGADLLAAFEERYSKGPSGTNVFSQYDKFKPKVLLEKGRRIARKVLQSQQRGGSIINKSVIYFATKVILQSLSRKGAADAFKEFRSAFGALQDLVKLWPTQSTFAIWHLSLSHLDLQAAKLYKVAHDYGDVVQPSSLMGHLILRLVSMHDYYQVRMIFDDYRKHHGLPAAELFALVIGETSRQGDAIAFHSLFQEYRHHFGNPKGPRMYQQLLHVHSRRMELKEVVDNFDSLQTVFGFVPNVDCWNTVIAAHARLSDAKGAIKWYEKMLESEVTPDANTLSTLATMYAPGGDVDAIESLLRDCEQRGLQLSTSMIDSLVLANIKIGDHEEAERIVGDALKMDLVGSRTHMWNYILNSAALQRDLEHLNYLHQCMQEADIPSDALTYAALMQGLCVQGLAQSAAKILFYIMPREGLRATAFHYAVVMGGLLNVGRYDKVFKIYQSMLNNNIRANFSTNSLLIKAATYADAEDHVTDGQSQGSTNYRRATELLPQILKTMDPMDVALPEPLKGVGPQRLDEAFTSNLFEYLIYLHAQSGSVDKVPELYQQYLSTIQEFRPGTEPDLPIKMLTALMVSHLKLNQHDEVEKCWYLALEKAEPLARRSGASLASPGWVLPARRLILSLPLMFYIKSLTYQNRIDDIAAVLADLHSAGYALTSKAWNLYVQCLAQSGHARTAFLVAEKHLMDGWAGWRPRGSYLPAINIRGKSLIATRLQDNLFPEQRVPNFRTMAALAEAYRDMRSRYTFASPTDGPLQKLHREAPRVVRAVVDMPRVRGDWRAWGVKANRRGGG
ncbi:hypothetical protein MMC13_007848 [Lambiella insularis]|nr:hypothetical protein [Lambiella insularis]